MARYQRESNFLGWMAFFSCGALVFGGLVVGLFYLKNRMPADQKNLTGAVNTNDPLRGRKPEEIVKEYLIEDYKKRNKAVTTLKGPFQYVHVKKTNRPGVVIRMQHFEPGQEEDKIDQAFIIQDGRVTDVAKWDDWMLVKDQYVEAK
jgi:hypothetical protein